MPGSPSGDFGRLAFGFLAVSALSGLALVPFFSAAHAAESLERLQGGMPWGFFLRALHAFSSFGLLVTTAAHLVQVLARRTERQLPAGAWWRSVLLLPLTILALLSGFVLRGDAAAAEALPVWSRIAETVPFLGPELARLLLGVIPGDVGAISLHHAGTFTVLLWLVTAEHGRRLVPDARSLVLAGLVSAALAGTVPLPLGPPPDASPGGAARILLGPWYLLGLQGALVDLPVPSAWLAPLLLVLLLGTVRHADGRARRLLLILAGAWAAAWVAFTARILLLAR
ncbi:MAG TPA: cytochrome b N-terminal domain-containing protein [Thermoanaerobaculia bacterium]|nr:cytochrome b N-terminal domain-containing protein [Thermoanaerobaculia bacterium]